jgi:hypothetical protein
MNTVIGPNWFAVFMRVLSIGMGSGMFCLLVFLALNAASTSEQLSLALLALIPLCLILLPALRGLLTWPINVRIDTASGTLSARSLLGGTESISVSEIVGVRSTKIWHGGRQYCDGVILLLANGKRLVFSSGNLHSVREIQDTFTRTDAPSVQSVKSVDAFP